MGYVLVRDSLKKREERRGKVAFIRTKRGHFDIGRTQNICLVLCDVAADVAKRRPDLHDADRRRMLKCRVLDWLTVFLLELRTTCCLISIIFKLC